MKKNCITSFITSFPRLIMGLFAASLILFLSGCKPTSRTPDFVPLYTFDKTVVEQRIMELQNAISKLPAFDRSEEDLEKRLDLFNRLGACHWLLQDYFNAEQAWQQCLQVSPNDSVALYNMAMLRRNHGQFSEALSFIEQIESRPEFVFIKSYGKGLVDLQEYIESASGIERGNKLLSAQQNLGQAIDVGGGQLFFQNIHASYLLAASEKNLSKQETGFDRAESLLFEAYRRRLNQGPNSALFDWLSIELSRIKQDKDNMQREIQKFPKKDHPWILARLATLGNVEAQNPDAGSLRAVSDRFQETSPRHSPNSLDLYAAGIDGENIGELSLGDWAQLVTNLRSEKEEILDAAFDSVIHNVKDPAGSVHTRSILLTLLVEASKNSPHLKKRMDIFVQESNQLLLDLHREVELHKLYM